MQKVAFLFPGQGSQVVGMGRALCERYPAARQVFAQADEVLGYPLSRLCFEGPKEELMLTANAQPGILTCSIATLRAIEVETGHRLSPHLVAGHSLGEYSALVCAGSLSFEDAVRLVHLRGTYMQEAVPAGEGAMAAILGATEEQVKALCEESQEGKVVSPANFNGAGQIVIAGHDAAVERAIAKAKSFGAKRALKLPVSAPFHCALMEPAALRLSEEINKVSFSQLTIPVVTNVEAISNQDDARVGELLVKQVTSPVRWEASVMYMVEQGVEMVIEIGPGKVLTGLMKRIARSVKAITVETPDQIEKLQDLLQ